MASSGTGPGRVSLIALLAAAAWSLALFVAGFTVPVYRSVGVGSAGEPTHSTDTLLGVNWLGAVVVLAIPVLVTVLVTCALVVHARRGARKVAWTLTGLLAALNLLAIMTIGVFVVPVTAALVVACAACPRTGAAVTA